MALLVALTVAIRPPPAGALSPPTGFADTAVAVNLQEPIWMELAPDGRIFVATGNAVRRIEIVDDSGVTGTFIDLPQVVDLETGLLGLAFDPDFETTGVVYIAYLVDEVDAPQRFRLSRFDSDGTVADAGSEVVLVEFDDISPGQPLHQGGDIEFGPDQMLYWAIGDRVMTTEPQQLDTPFGKVLRFNPDGTIPSDNPFYTQTTGLDRAIYALGLRNPWRMTPNPTDGSLYISEVGPQDWEEINRLQYGADYGWPTVTGTGHSQFVDPELVYSHDPDGCAVVGTDFYQPAVNQFPELYQGDLFYADHCHGWLAHFDPVTGEDRRFAAGAHRLADVKVHPITGALYYLDREFNGDQSGFTGGIGRIDYIGGQLGLQFSAEPLDAIVAQGETAHFTVGAFGVVPLSYQWMDDGVPIAGATTSALALPAVTAADDQSAITVVVGDGSGASITSDVALLHVGANTAPVPTIDSPAAGASYAAGDVVSFSGSADDLEDGPLPAAALQWDVVFHHNTHTHEFQPGISGVTGGSVTLPMVGETDADVWYRFTLTATDSEGAERSVWRDVQPLTADITLDSEPVGLEVQLDGTLRAAPHTFTGVVGMQRTIGAPSPQFVATTPFAFLAWSDLGDRVHTITTPPTDATITAEFEEVDPDEPPTIVIDQPMSSQPTPAPLLITGTAQDTLAVTEVDLIVRNTATDEYWDEAAGVFQPSWRRVVAQLDQPGATSTSWSFSFDPATSASIRISARARDAGGNFDWDYQNSNVIVGGAIDEPPMVTLADPAHQSTVTRPVTITGSATDDGTIELMALVIKRVGAPEYWDGTQWLPGWRQVTPDHDPVTGVFTYEFDPGTDGSARVYARARDDLGQQELSNTNRFNYASGTNLPPTVTLVAPAHQSTSTRPVEVRVEAADDGGVAAVSAIIKRVGAPEWWTGSAWVGQWAHVPAVLDPATGHYLYQFDPGTAGSARISARAIDDTGLRTFTIEHKVTYD